MGYGAYWVNLVSIWPRQAMSFSGELITDLDEENV